MDVAAGERAVRERLDEGVWAMMLLMALAPWALYIVFEEGA